jgi:type II secretory pathway pseudopilin PulG
VNKYAPPLLELVHKSFSAPQPQETEVFRDSQGAFHFSCEDFRRISFNYAGDPSRTSGFTLVELLVAAVMSVIIAGVAIGGLITAQENSQKADRKLEQQAALQRTLNYIATDIQEGVRIKLVDTPNLTASYTPLFNIPRSNGSIAAYYSRSSSGTVWQTPIVIYRRLWPNPSDPTTGDLDHYPLIDAIANNPPQNASCQAPSGFTASTPDIGLKIFVPTTTTPSTRAIICLRGSLAPVPLPGIPFQSGLDTFIDATVRNSSP